MSPREKNLAAAFALLLAATAVGTAWMFRYDRMRELDAGITSYRAMLDRIGTQRDKVCDPAPGKGESRTAADLREAVRELSSRFYGPGEIDLYRFGLELEAIVSSCGLKRSSCRTVRGACPALEYELTGDTYSCMEVLKRLSEAKKAVRLDDLSIRCSGREVLVTMKAGYVERDSKGD